MSSDGKFIVIYIKEAVEQDKDPLELAKQEIAEIDEILEDAARLKLRRMKLVSVLDHFGDESYRQKRTIEVPSSDDVEPSDNFIELTKAILRELENGPLSVHELTPRVSSYDQHPIVIRAIKWLGDKDLISRRQDKKLELKENNNE